MPAPIRSVLDRLNVAVRGFTLAQRTFAVLAAVALLIAAVGVGGWLTKPTMSPLFGGLSGTDASAIVDKLTADGVAYELADGGSTVLVPRSDLYAQRIAMAAAGLPAEADGSGYSLLDSLPVTASDFQQQTAYQRATEGELARTVAAIDGIEAATVRLALPDDSVFVSQQSDPTASVFVRTRPGMRLSTDQVEAIVHLVSAGISDMAPTDVAVIDASGEVLSAVGTGQTGGGLAQAGDYEARVRQAVQNLLDPLVGPGKSAVTVTAELDLDTSQRTTEEYSATPDTPPFASSTTTEEYTGTGAGAGATGVLGPDNIAVPSGQAGSGGEYSSTSTDVTNPVNKATEVVTRGPGGVERQSVSVAVDEAAAGELDMAALTAAISAAAGIDAARGDTLSVQKMAFDTTRQEAAQDALAQADEERAADERESLITKAAIAGVALVALLVLLTLAGRRSRRLRREAIDLGALEVATTPPGSTALLDGVDALPELPPVPTAPPNPYLTRRLEVEALADEQPAEIAELLRGWLSAPSGRSRR